MMDFPVFISKLTADDALCSKTGIDGYADSIQKSICRIRDSS